MVGKKTKEDFIRKSQEIHGDKYDYSKVEYINNETKVCIICPEHGEFWQRPINHYHSKGCYKCGKNSMKNKQSMSYDEFIEKARKIHNNKYDYSKVVMAGANTPITIICPQHGEFLQTPSAHINSKQGCPKCGRISANKTKSLTNETFIAKAKEIHGDEYVYSKVNYINYDTKVIIICPQHGEFLQTPDSHLQGKKCSKCSHSQSYNETEIVNFFKEKNIKIEERKRDIIYPYEIDIYFPEKKIGIEYNGIRWHSDKFKIDKNYHLNKTNMCKEKNIGLIQIFEDEFINKKDIVYKKLEHILGYNVNLPKIYGRKCIISKITYETSKQFLNMCHIQGNASGTVYYGAFYENRLIGVMVFKKEKNDKWGLIRFATDYNYVCCGVGGKLFNFFIKEYNPQEIKTFADRRWTVNNTNNLYTQLGFKFESFTPPSYYYVINNVMKRYHKFNFRKKKLLNKYPDILTSNMTEKEMTEKLGIYRIYDCGLIKYVWKNLEN